MAQERAPEPPPGFLAGQASNPSVSSETGLLFYLSGENGTTADFAGGGQLLPNYVNDVKVIPDGAHGQALELDESMQLTYWAPGNIYAQRGTLSFFWRSRYPVGPTEFPIFRVGYADHSSHDMTWLRIDYNGSGFDAFVTDIGLSRTRVSHYMNVFPEPDEWIHIALSWDETEGIRLYVNGEFVERQSVTGKFYDTGLDQFGPHHRYIAPTGVRSDYNFGRTGDLDELRIYDRMLSDENIAELSQGEIPIAVADVQRDLNERKWRNIWWARHGWDLPNDAPPLLNSSVTSVRKVEIHDAIDIKRWYWKANDGIRETTWPGVYNMSRLPGRFDYFNWPDWDTYSMSGQTVRFHLPEDEPWNHVEMWGTAWGQLTHESEHPYDHTFAVRKNNQVKSYHRLDEEKRGGKIRFDNALIEESIGSFMVYYVEDGIVPKGMTERSYVLHPAPTVLDSSLDRINAFIRGRHPADEHMMMLGIPEGTTIPVDEATIKSGSLPIIHILIPYEEIQNVGLDGIAIELPGLNVEPTHKGAYPLNIRIKDPLWEMRDLMDFSFSVNPGTPHTLWLDMRDIILPEGRGLYLTISGAGSDFIPELLKGTGIRMVYKTMDEAIAEHEIDRFTQMRDVHANNSEASPRSPRLNNYNRFHAYAQDILKNNPDHWLAQAYWYWVSRDQNDRPEYKIMEAPEGVPEWAHLQVEYIRQLERIVMYYIDERQISNGEFGGGLSDDGDFTNFFPAIAFLGIQPEKILASLRLHIEGYYDQDRDSYDVALRQRSLPLFTNGLATIQSDELHSYEDGIQVVAQLQLLDFGTPLHFNRGMETAKQMLERITQISPDGHRRFRSRYYGGTKLATEDPWQWQKNNSFINLHTALLIAKYNGNPKLTQMIIELADGLLATQTEEGIFTEVHFETGEIRGNPGIGRAWNVMLAAYDFTGNPKYLQPISERTGIVQDFNKDDLVNLYSDLIKERGVREYISTEGSIWIDRVPIRDIDSLQDHRMGGVSIIRATHIYPQHHVSWEFKSPADPTSVAIFIPEANSESINIIAYTLASEAVNTYMTTWDIKPGRWRIRQGLDTNEDQQINTDLDERVIDLKHGEILDFVFSPREYTIINMELIEPNETSYWERPDLAIGPTDVKLDGNNVTVRVHNLGAVNSPSSSLELRDAHGNFIASAVIPELEAPIDLIPRWKDIKLTVPEGTDLSSASIQVDPEKKIIQITRRNTIVQW